MGKIANNIFNLVSRYKYLIVIIFGVLIVGFLDDNSILRRIEYTFEVSDLEKEIAYYTERYESDSRKLKDLERNPKLIERIAREKYFMKCDDEDIFILSDDEKPETDIVQDEAGK